MAKRFHLDSLADDKNCVKKFNKLYNIFYPLAYDCEDNKLLEKYMKIGESIVLNRVCPTIKMVLDYDAKTNNPLPLDLLSDRTYEIIGMIEETLKIINK